MHFLLSPLKKIFTGYSLFIQILAIGLTYFLVVSGIDWKYYLYFENSTTRAFLSGAPGLGFLIPVFVPIIFILIGFLRRNIVSIKKGLIMLQAVVFGLFISSFYKFFTGRVPPPRLSEIQVDRSHIFQFGFDQGGVFWGWPSSHTTVIFALATSVVLLYPKNKFLSGLSLLIALYIGLGVSMSIHWFSDFVAGLILGVIIGFACAKRS